MIFTKENLKALKHTCQKIISLTNEHVDGNLMMSQLQFLGENIKEFAENPIVSSSGLIQKQNNNQNNG